jgi:hypothetical protein
VVFTGMFSSHSYFRPDFKRKGQILSNKNFKAGEGWLDKFKKRHGIRYLSIAGEKLASNIAAEIC